MSHSLHSMMTEADQCDEDIPFTPIKVTFCSATTLNLTRLKSIHNKAQRRSRYTPTGRFEPACLCANAPVLVQARNCLTIFPSKIAHDCVPSRGVHIDWYGHGPYTMDIPIGSILYIQWSIAIHHCFSFDEVDLKFDSFM